MGWSAANHSEIAATAKTHIVIAGDTLWKIANQYGTSIQAIVDKNNLTNTNIWVGQKLLIP
ncbi:LysM peptidoglycan-binding domain-containing protein [Bacillus sp. 1P10SD]